MSMWEDYKADTQFERDYQFGIPGDVWHSRDGYAKCVVCGRTAKKYIKIRLARMRMVDTSSPLLKNDWR